MKKLPIGIQSFEQIRTGDYIYVDKTKQALDLIERYKYVFLSRPRRFGKSLFTDTLYHIFIGNKDLFKGLYIYDKYDFEPYPVIRINWSGNFSTQEKTELRAKKILKNNALQLGIDCDENDLSSCFEDLIKGAYKKYHKQVVILVDEYDKPILDNIANIKEADNRRTLLRGIYEQIKANDAYVRFAFFTGISKFSRASIFSGLNNLQDISLMPRYATICGYTHQDLLTVFKDYFTPDVDMEKVKEWYNGYNFLGENVYNPFDILLFIDNSFVYDAYWWTSGTPFSLIEILRKGEHNFAELQNMELSSTALNSADLEDIQIESLLFQAGYLTIDKVLRDEFTEQIFYRLRVPNKEVQISLNQLIYKYLTNNNYELASDLLRSLYNGQIDKLKEKLTSIFASIPYTNYVNNFISDYEGYYASVVYAYLLGLGVKAIAEDITNKGRIDLTLFIKDKVYVIEFKIGTEGSALEQIKQRKYYEKYRAQATEIYLIGINFDKEKRNLAKFEWEKL